MTNPLRLLEGWVEDCPDTTCTVDGPCDRCREDFWEAELDQQRELERERQEERRWA